MYHVVCFLSTRLDWDHPIPSLIGRRDSANGTIPEIYPPRKAIVDRRRAKEKTLEHRTCCTGLLETVGESKLPRRWMILMLLRLHSETSYTWSSMVQQGGRRSAKMLYSQTSRGSSQLNHLYCPVECLDALNEHHVAVCSFIAWV